MNPHQFRRQRRHTLLFGFATFAIPQVVGALLARFLMGFSWPAAILLASLFASHTLVPYPIVSQLGLGRNRAVNTAIGGTIMTDTAALLVLAVVAETTVRGLSGAFLIRQMILLALLLLIVLWGLRRVGYAFFRLATPDGVTEFIFVLASVFVSSYLATLAGVEPIIGAFFAGLALSPLIPDTSPLHNRLEFTGKAIFIPFFLLSVGMLVNIEAFMSGFRGWAMALMMTGTVVSTKWSAAWLSGRVLGYSRDEIRLLFGLTVNQAAATLAAVLVGYRIGLLDESVLNGTILMILITCILGPSIAEAAARRLVMTQATAAPERAPESARLMVPLSNEATAGVLTDLALMLREPPLNEPIRLLNVIRDGPEVEAGLAAADRLLAEAVVRAAAADVPVMPLTRIETNVSAGILRSLAEFRVSTVVMGWEDRSVARRFIFHSIADQVLSRSRQMMVLARITSPLNTTQRLVMLVPHTADLHPGFNTLSQSLRNMAAEMGASLLVVGTEEAATSLREKAEKGKRALKAETYVLPAMSDIADALTPLMKKGDAIVLCAVRRGRPGWQPRLERVPSELARRFAAHTLLVVYPPEVEAAEVIKEGAPASTALPAGLTDSHIRLGLAGGDLDGYIKQLLATALPGRARWVGELRNTLLAMEPVELAPAVVLLHAHVADLTEGCVFVGEMAEGVQMKGLRRAARVMFILLSPEDQPPEKHLEALARIARMTQIPDFARRIGECGSPADVLALLATAAPGAKA